MLITDDMNERVAVFGAQAIAAHAPEWGKQVRLPGSDFPQEPNLALGACTRVDSFYGTLNTGDEAGLYPVLNQVAVSYEPAPAPGGVVLRLSTVTPGFTGFRWRKNGGPWQEGLDTALYWGLRPGANDFEVRAKNRAGHLGRISLLRLALNPDRDRPWPDYLHEIQPAGGRAEPARVPFGWEDFGHERLLALRARYALDEVVAGTHSDLERVVRLRDWVKSRWDHAQPVNLPCWDGLYILDQVALGVEEFFCVHYSVTFMQCCLALGIPARLINLHRGIASAPLVERGNGRECRTAPPSDEHVVNEVWLDDQGRWAMMDVDFDIHYQREGVVLSALEIHRALLAGELDRLEVCEGPLAYKLKAAPYWYQSHLPTYYAHFCVFWRNNHLSDGDGPTRILHWVDEKTPPMLWWEGSDLRHHPAIIGPMAASWPYGDVTPRLTDGNVATCWASDDSQGPHWVELSWPEPVTFGTAVLSWPRCWRRYWTSEAYQLQAWQADDWHDLAAVTSNREAAHTVHSFAPVTTSRLRLWQPAGGGPAERPNMLWLSEIEVYR